MADDVPVWATAPLTSTGWTPVEDAPPWAKTEEKKKKPDIGYLGAAGAGAKSGATFGFGDELAGLRAASGAEGFSPYGLGETALGALRLLYERARGVEGPATEAYKKRRDEERDKLATAREQYPWTTGVSEFAGGAAVPLPGGTWASAGRSGLRRLAGGALQGGIGGGLVGAGEAETAGDIPQKAATGAGIGLVGGGLVSGVLAPALSHYIYNPVSALFSPEKVAGEHLAWAAHAAPASEKVAAGAQPQQRLLPTEAPADAMVLDYLGYPGRQMARWAKNISPEAGGVLEGELTQRGQGQYGRLRSDIEAKYGISDNALDRAALAAEASRTNSPLYRRAYAEGQGNVVSPGLIDLAGTPAIQNAAKDIMPSLQNRAFTEGFPLDPATAIRSLPFWDQVSRNLNRTITMAQKAGDRETVSEIKPIRDRLLAELDNIVPSFREARGSARAFFGEGNAMEAGEKFASDLMSSKVRITPEQGIAAMRNMTAQEQDAFRKSAINRFMNDVRGLSDNVDIWKKINQNDAARNKMEMLLGPQGFRELEATHRVERIMQMANEAVRGNSSTMQQYLTFGLMGAGGGLMSDIYGGSTPGFGTSVGSIGALGLLRARRGIDMRVADRLASMLTSRDPRQIDAVIKTLSRNEGMMNVLRNFSAGQIASRGAATEAARAGAAQ